MLKNILIFLFTLSGIFSCSEKDDKLFYLQIFDTIPKNLVLAAFKEDGAIGILLVDKNDSSKINKLTFRENFPMYVDTLKRIKHLAYKSIRFNQTYLIEDTVVKMIYIESMVHPCYTWQGQTPVTRTMSLTFKKIKWNR